MDTDKDKGKNHAQVGRLFSLHLGQWLKGVYRSKGTPPRLNVLFATKVMAVICIIVTVFFMVNYVRVGIYLAQRFKQVIAKTEAYHPERKAVFIPEVDILDVLAAARHRNMFTFLPTDADTEGRKSTETEPLIQNFKLVGIIWLDNPQVMIEDNQTQETHLLGVGKKFGQFTIIKILRDKVIVRDERYEYELR